MIQNKKTFVNLVLFISLLLVAALVFAHGVSEADKAAAAKQGAGWYIWFGATHMLTGYDHLLFVFGVVFFLNRFIDILKYVTGFTVGHTLTLITATYMGVKVNAALIDAFIAMSVVYIAFVNMKGFQRVFKVDPPDMFVMVFVIGLVHGMGLSTSLQESLPADVPGLLLKIISFNIGVELGQIAALVGMLVVLRLFRGETDDTFFARASNFLIAGFGFILFFHQLHLFQHQVFPDEFKPHHQHTATTDQHEHGPGTHTHGTDSHTHGPEGHTHSEQPADTPAKTADAGKEKPVKEKPVKAKPAN